LQAPLHLNVPYVVRIRFRRPLSDRRFLRICRANPDLRLERTARGELIVMTPASADAGRRNADLSTQLGTWARADGRGFAFDSSAGFTLPNGAVRAPDASWILKDRWDALTPDERKGFAHVCPDFVAELRSASDRLRDLREKMAEYLGQGARLGWLIDPPRRVVEVYRPGREVDVLTGPASVSGGDVLPGFVLDLKDIL